MRWRNAGDQRGFAVHVAVDFQLGCLRQNDIERGAQLAAGFAFVAAEVRARDQRDLRLDAEAAHLRRGEDRHLGDFSAHSGSR